MELYTRNSPRKVSTYVNVHQPMPINPESMDQGDSRCKEEKKKHLGDSGCKEKTARPILTIRPR